MMVNVIRELIHQLAYLVKLLHHGELICQLFKIEKWLP
jgi:hypothetical protein